MSITKTAVILFTLTITSLPAQAKVIKLTEDGLDMDDENHGVSLFINNVLEITALTSITPQGYKTGTVYLDEEGIGVQTLAKKGSKGISGSNRDQDEALILNFTGGVLANSLQIGLKNYKACDDNTILTLGLWNGDELTFDKNHQNWNSATTYKGNGKTGIDVGKLLGQTYITPAISLSVMETRGHIYLNSVGYQTIEHEIPEPATVTLLGIGSLLMVYRKRNISTI